MSQVEQSFWNPGSIVKLNEPCKPAFADPDEYGFSRQEWREWEGFTHGIIVQVLTPVHDARFPGNQRKRFSLHLYDPQTRRIDMHPSGIPTYVDFSENDLTPFKDAAVKYSGYETLV